MKIKKFLPKKQEFIAVKTLIDESLFEKVNSKRKELGVTWNELQQAMFRVFLEDTDRSKK